MQIGKVDLMEKGLQLNSDEINAVQSWSPARWKMQMFTRKYECSASVKTDFIASKVNTITASLYFAERRI